MEHNAIVNRYLSDNERYADLINGCQFGGEQVITAKDLMEIDTQVNVPPEDSTTKKTGNRKTKYRDLIRKVAFGVNFMVLGIENQEEVHYLMPLRTLEYDVREYRRQANVIRKKTRKRKKLSAGEFLSGFGRNDKLYPCVTFVLYYGDEWDGGRELHDILNFRDIPERLKPLVNNYKIHLLEIKKLQDTNVFRTDLKQVFDFIRYSEDGSKLRKLIEQDVAYQHLDEDAYDMVALYTKSTEMLELKNQSMEREGVNMCKGLRDIMQEEREEGRAEGRAEALVSSQIDNIRKMIKNLKISVEQAMDILEIEGEERSKYLELISVG